MDKSRPYKKKAVRLFQKLRSNKNRFSGILLIVLGVVLGIAARGTGGSPVSYTHLTLPTTPYV